MSHGAPGAAGADRCPLCGDVNGCAMAAETPARCWCVDASFDPALRERAARADGPQRCICARCASAARGEAAAQTPPSR